MPDPAESRGGAIDKQVLRVAYTAVFTGLLATLDSTIVTVSMSSISADLHAPLAAAQWVVTGYLLALALSLPVSGWLVDRVGVRRSFLIAVTAFAISSGLCAAAPSLTVLVVLRVVQGLAGGLLVPMGQVIVTQVTPDEQLGRVMSVVGAPAALGPVLGPVVGGLITTVSSWHWVFLVNLPIAAVALMQGARRLPRADSKQQSSRAKPDQEEHFDVVGLLLIGPGLALLVYAMTTVGQAPAPPGSDQARPSYVVTWLPAVVGLVLLAAFIWWSLRRPASGPRAALVDLRLLTRRPFGPSVLAALLSRAVGDGAVLLVAIYLQQQRGATPILAGLILLPQGLGAIAGLRLGGRLIDQRGARLTSIIGAIVLVIGTIPLALSTSLPLVVLLLALAGRGLGTSLVGLPPVAAAYQGLDRARAPRATTTLNIAQRLGSPLGTALLVTTLTVSATRVPAAPAFQLAFAVAALATAGLLPLSLALPRRTKSSP